jgi:inorganic pyrophosphatase
MSASLTDLPHDLDRQALTCRAIVETPHGLRAKFIYDEETRLFALGKLLPVGLAFPVDFGFVPSTLGGDGDPIDLLILAEAELPVGCLVTVRLLGSMEVEQWRDGEPRVRNDRLIARLAESRAFAAVERTEQLGEGFADELDTFFRTYKEARGQQFEVLAIGGPERAVELIEEAAKRR